MARIYVSTVLPAAVDRVWREIRDFNPLPTWHPAVRSSEIEENRPSDQVGCVRHFFLQDGGELREQLLTLSDPDHMFTYSILASPMPVANYVATVALKPVMVSGQTFGEWSAEFDVTDSSEAATVALVTNVFQTGFESLGPGRLSVSGNAPLIGVMCWGGIPRGWGAGVARYALPDRHASAKVR